MKSYQITFGRYQVYHEPAIIKPIPRREKADISRLRCALPFILFDIAIIGGVVFLYTVQKRIIPVSVAAFFPYVLISFLLARIRTGFGGRYGRCVVFSYLSVFIFFTTVAALALAVEVKILQIGALIVAGVLLFISNVILLPLHIGRVLEEKDEMSMNECSSLCYGPVSVPKHPVRGPAPVCRCTGRCRV